MQYGFYDRLKKEFPSQIIVDVTENCNFACSHCPHSNLPKSKLYAGANLDIRLNNKMVDEVKKHGVNLTQQIRYSANGEPLLHPNIFDMIRYATNNSGVMVTLTTNGSLLNERNIKEILDTSLDLIDISIDANSVETYTKIRRNGVFEITKSNVLNLLEAKVKSNNKLNVVVSFVEQELNKHETVSFKKFWEENGVDYVIIRRLHSAGGAIYHIANDMKMKKINRRPCVYPWERIVLNSKGFLDFCPDSWMGKTNIRNYNEVTIYEVWKSEFYNSLRNAHLNSKFDGYDTCLNCPDWVQTCWPEERRGYGDMIAKFSKEDHFK